MREAQHLFAQIPTLDGVEQTARSAGAAQLRHGLFHAPWSHVPALFVERVKRWVGSALRWSARAALLSPLLIALRFGPREVGDAGIVIVVLLAVTFFSLLNLFVLLSLLSYRARKRASLAPVFRLPFSREGHDVLGLTRGGDEAGKDVGPGSRVRVTGVLRGVPRGARGATLVEEFWWPTEARLTEALEFILDRGDLAPVVLELEAAPVVIAPSQLKALSEVLIDPATVELLPIPKLPEGPCEYVRLCDGDEVVLVGTVERVGPLGERFAAAASPTGPYRGGPQHTGIVIRSSYDRPACFVLTRARFA
jgi:hypothetical protein